MAVYLYEDMFGRDQNTIGMINLVGCLGIVIVCDHEMYGIHSSSTGESLEVIGEFRTFCEGRQFEIRRAQSVFASADFSTRYEGSVAGWEQEIRQFCRYFGYQGNVFCFNTGVVHPAMEGAYVEFRRSAQERGQCAVFYKRSAKITIGASTMVPNSPQANLAQYSFRSHRLRNSAVSALRVSGKRSFLHRGTFHQAKGNKLLQITA